MFNLAIKIIKICCIKINDEMLHVQHMYLSNYMYCLKNQKQPGLKYPLVFNTVSVLLACTMQCLYYRNCTSGMVLMYSLVSVSSSIVFGFSNNLRLI